ncbi:hypothetical protein MMC34_001420 [Xylographa carneopallida]|nr:hypothetical protein [Xylographa carneopallida]
MPLPATHPQIIQQAYSARASKYDVSWHVPHAADFVRWACIAPGQHVLDLACGTGLVTLPAAAVVGPRGSVTGIDLTAEMLAIARSKAETQQGLSIEFVQHDITQLSGLGLRAGYDAITCASAVPLLEEPGLAMEHWATFLKPGGRLVVDVPTERSQIPGLVFETVATEVGVPLPFGRLWIAGPESLEAVVVAAGLQVEQSFVARGYESARTYSRDEGGELFDRWVEGPFRQLSPRLGADAGMSARARAMFIEMLASRAGPDGVVREEEGFYVVVGRKS